MSWLNQKNTWLASITKAWIKLSRSKTQVPSVKSSQLWLRPLFCNNHTPRQKKLSCESVKTKAMHLTWVMMYSTCPKPNGVLEHFCHTRPLANEWVLFLLAVIRWHSMSSTFSLEQGISLTMALVIHRVSTSRHTDQQSAILSTWLIQTHETPVWLRNKSKQLRGKTIYLTWLSFTPSTTIKISNDDLKLLSKTCHLIKRIKYQHLLTVDVLLVKGTYKTLHFYN